MEKQKAENQALAEELRALIPSQTIDLAPLLSGKPAAIELSSYRTLTSLKKLADEYRTTPERRKGVSTHATLLSLVEHTNRFKNGNSVLFADPGDGAKANPVMLAVLNYNPAGGAATMTDWGDHCGRYSFPLSEQWKLWKSLDGAKMNVAQFARFIEAQIEDIADPAEAGKIAKQIPERLGYKLATPSEVLNLSKGLSLVVDHTVTNVIDPNSGERQLQFEQKHKDKAGKPLEVVKAFLILIPVFQSGTVYPVGVRLTYEVNGETVLFTCHMYREDLFFKDAFETACEDARNATSLPLYFGTPEK